jgi:PAS domain S-box-containing protein
MNPVIRSPEALGQRAADMGRTLCLLGAGLGVVGLAGWITGISPLTTLIPGQPQMKANTAVALLLTGLAGAARRDESGPGVVRIVASAAAVVVLAVGLGTLLEYASGIDLGIDQLLFTSGAERHPGRPSPPSVLALTLLAVALLLFDLRPRSRSRPSEWMILASGLIGFAAVVGAAFGAGPLYRLRTVPITGVAVPTAVSLMLISAGMFLERPAGGLAQLTTSPGPGGALLRRLALPGLALPVLLAFVLSRLFGWLGIRDVALLFATLVACTTVLALALLAVSAAPLDRTHIALEASRSRMRELVQQAPDGIFVAALDGRYTDVNRAGCQMLGFSRGELVGKTIVDLIPAEEVGRLAASKEQLLRGRAEVSEWRLRRKDGTFLPVELNAKILPDGRWQAFVRDISERKRAEEALRRIADEERLFADVGSILATTLDYEETLVAVARLVAGALADVCVVESVEDGGGLRRVTVSREDQSPVSVDVPRPLLGSAPREPLLAPTVESEEHRLALGALAAKSLIALPLAAQGRAVGSLILVRTTRMDPYGPRDLFVAQEVGRRAALAIENARLYRLAQSAIRARDDVLGIVAHDLRNPLGGISLQAEFLTRKTPEGDMAAHKAAEKIKRATARMNRLIQDLLDVTRMEAGHLSVEMTMQPIGEVISEALEAQRPHAAEVATELRSDLTSELPELRADRDRLIQVFENLIGNALKFAPPGSQVVVGAQARGPDVLCWVADNGPGIPADAKAHLFDRFWQLKRADRRGAGLGLPIVKGIVEAHGGRIWVESLPGEGSTFFFTIPAVAGSPDAQNLPAAH